ncbi:xanthine dehydrogenase accessory protein XdhC [Palleronia rufa]|uniref:xanthine dehydrogenase accessory protein XdhC n=1 Tax=Palleronia rufa TaxID=1530186 RepID=UPI00055EA09B|nr:xanthine dehydrogenase accessory protein XdhC [Palleronia rufa]
MSFDASRLRSLLRDHPVVWRVLILDTRGSVPRQAGTAMFVWGDGQDGTIGGGRLEWEASAAARDDRTGLRTVALGPSLGQCCGGSVTLHLSRWTEDTPLHTGTGVCAHGPGAPTDAVRAALCDPTGPLPRVIDGFVLESTADPALPITVWGAGHVGRALVAVLAPMPDVAILWVDLPGKFPDHIPAGVTRLDAARPEIIARRAGPESHHVILTHSHDIDLALCHALLTAGVASVGLIGSATKWARFRSRLAALGHASDAIARIRCPIGDPALGKHPQAIAIGVAAALISRQDAAHARRIAG